jgi:hypothetical protein
VDRWRRQLRSVTTLNARIPTAEASGIQMHRRSIQSSPLPVIRAHARDDTDAFETMRGSGTRDAGRSAPASAGRKPAPKPESDNASYPTHTRAKPSPLRARRVGVPGWHRCVQPCGCSSSGKTITTDTRAAGKFGFMARVLRGAPTRCARRPGSKLASWCFPALRHAPYFRTVDFDAF